MSFDLSFAGAFLLFKINEVQLHRVVAVGQMSELMCQTAIFTRVHRCFGLTCDQVVLLPFCLLAEETHRKKNS